MTNTLQPLVTLCHDLRTDDLVAVWGELHGYQIARVPNPTGDPIEAFATLGRQVGAWMAEMNLREDANL